MVFRATFAVTDVYKLTLLFVVNMFTITVLELRAGIRPALIIALSFSEVFTRRAAVRRGQFRRASPEEFRGSDRVGWVVLGVDMPGTGLAREQVRTNDA